MNRKITTTQFELDVRALVAYLYKGEQDHCATCDALKQETHIFADIKQLHDASCLSRDAIDADERLSAALGITLAYTFDVEARDFEECFGVELDSMTADRVMLPVYSSHIFQAISRLSQELNPVSAAHSLSAPQLAAHP